MLGGGAHPSRNIEQNLADLRAQIAANEKGVQELQAMVAQFGRETVAAYMGHVQDNAEESVRRVITALKDGEFVLPLDNGARIQVRVKVDAAARSATVDFSGTSARSCRTTSMRRARSRWRRYCMCSARWSTTTFRSTRVASSRSR